MFGIVRRISKARAKYLSGLDDLHARAKVWRAPHEMQREDGAGHPAADYEDVRSTRCAQSPTAFRAGGTQLAMTSPP